MERIGDGRTRFGGSNSSSRSETKERKRGEKKKRLWIDFLKTVVDVVEEEEELDAIRTQDEMEKCCTPHRNAIGVVATAREVCQPEKNRMDVTAPLLMVVSRLLRESDARPLKGSPFHLTQS